MRIVCFLAAVLIAGAVNAQSGSGPKQANGRYAVSIHPLQFIIRGQRLDAEVRIKDSRHWLQFGPQIYSGNTVYRENLFDERENHALSGFGLEVAHKIIMDSGRSVYTYVTYGAAFHRFTIGFDSPSWDTIQEDGLTYYRYADKSQEEKIARWSGMITAGVIVPLSNYFFMDFYTGVGMRNSTIKATTPVYPDYDGFLNYGFTGVYPIAGLKLGVRF